MQLRIAAHTPAVLEQSRIVRGYALEERLDRACNFDIARWRMTEQDPVVDRRADQIEDQVKIDGIAQIASRLRTLERAVRCYGP